MITNQEPLLNIETRTNPKEEEFSKVQKTKFKE